MVESSKDVQNSAKSQKAIKALGDLTEQSQEEQISLQVLQQMSTLMPKPQPGDWLVEHKEYGQSFENFSQVPRKISQKKGTKYIYIVPLEYDIDEDFQQKLKIYAMAFFYGMFVEFLPIPDFNKWNIDKRINDGVLQYNASQILNQLKKIKQKDSYCIIGIMMNDIYPRESWNFVFGIYLKIDKIKIGLASYKDRTGVFSFARFNQQFYDPESVPDKSYIIYRSCKVMCHELCHQFGIKHCIYYKCLMNGSNHYEEANQKPFRLCPVCLRKLQLCIGFNLRDRFQILEEASELLENSLNQQNQQILNNFRDPVFKAERLFFKLIQKQIAEKLDSSNDKWQQAQKQPNPVNKKINHTKKKK